MMTHFDYMNLALQLAERGRLTVSPNPMVGCVMVKHNRIVGHGFHYRKGEPHAEIHALQAAGSEARDATLYVTLEPCCHYGKTPPCTQALIAAGIKKIYVACLDPNPKVAGNGIAELQAAGISVELGLCAEQAKKLNEIFFHYHQHKRPFVIAKWAMSLDGKTVTASDDSRQISSVESQHQTHQLRHQVDAILVGSKTAISDNPQLTVRQIDKVSKQPLRIILASSGKLPFDLKLFDAELPGKTLIATTDSADPKWLATLREKNIEIMTLPKNIFGTVSLPDLLDELGCRGITSLLVEGGMTVLENFFQENLVNKINVYLAPVIIGNLERKISLGKINYSSLGNDFYLEAEYENV